jgi:hypothetical protein
MKLPREIRVLNSVYTVKFDEAMRGSPLAGEIQYHKRLIRLNPEMKKAPAYETIQTLWHEIVHAYAHESGLNQFLSDQAKEMVCESLSRLIIDLTGGKIKCASTK